MATDGIPFVQPGGAQTYPQPLKLEDCQLFSFVLSADQAALGRLCDRYLNGPAQGEAQFVPLASCALLVVAMIDKISCEALPPDQQFYIKETDIAFWIPVLRGRTEGGVFLCESLDWFLPYVFVDNSWAVASGREIYGYPKALASFQLPQTGNPDRFAVDTLVVKKFGPDVPATWQRLFEVEREGGMAGTAVARSFESLAEAGKALLTRLTDGLPFPVPGIGIASELLDFVVHGTIPLVFLKQFRDARGGSSACYQAVVEAPAQLEFDSIRNINELADAYRVTVHSFASHPIVKELGLRGTTDPATGDWTATATSAWQAEFSFQCLDATNIWPADPQ